MSEYHKINSIYKRDPSTNKFIMGDYAQEEFKYLAENQWEFTEKVDGTNIRVMWERFTDHADTITFGGRTDNAQIPAKLVTYLQATFTSDLMRSILPEGATLYGEGYGAGIQKGGGNYQATQEFVLFDVKVGSWWLKRDDVDDVARKLGIKSVPIIGRGTLQDGIEMVRGGFNSQWGNFLAEGIVARPTITLFNRRGERIITKIKCRDFK